VKLLIHFHFFDLVRNILKRVIKSFIDIFVKAVKLVNVKSKSKVKHLIVFSIKYSIDCIVIGLEIYF